MRRSTYSQKKQTQGDPGVRRLQVRKSETKTKGQWELELLTRILKIRKKSCKDAGPNILEYTDAAREIVGNRLRSNWSKIVHVFNEDFGMILGNIVIQFGVLHKVLGRVARFNRQLVVSKVDAT